jgi:hypothetical protein
MKIFSTAASLDTASAVAHDFMSSLSSADQTFVRQGDHDFGSVGRYIRNRYDLWHSSPLTKGWRENEAGRLIDKDGVDCSPDHPDNLTAEILRLARKM